MNTGHSDEAERTAAASASLTGGLATAASLIVFSDLDWYWAVVTGALTIILCLLVAAWRAGRVG